MSRIAITGAASFLGSRLLRRLVETPGARLGGGPGRHPSAGGAPRVSYRLVDLTLPAADRKLLEVLREDEVDTVLHTAFFTDPRRDTRTRTNSNPSAP